MSGGSWDYICFKVGDAAQQLKNEKCPYRRSFGDLLEKCSKALHDIEWADSCDISKDDELPAIKEVISPQMALGKLVEDAQNIKNQISKILEEINKENNV